MSPNPEYNRGARFERRVRDYLAKKGWVVIRSAGSRSPVDLVAARGGEVLVIQCKRDGSSSLAERCQLYTVAGEFEARPIIAEAPGGHILWAQVDEWGVRTETEL